MIQIDRVRTNAEIVGQPPPDAGRPAPSAATAFVFDHSTREQFREVVLDVLRQHLRDLERQGLL